VDAATAAARVGVRVTPFVVAIDAGGRVVHAAPANHLDAAVAAIGGERDGDRAGSNAHTKGA
ncbi:MAG: hypothetical protein ACRD0M_06145, partial [Acidimicrobiales bacterium]